MKSNSCDCTFVRDMIATPHEQLTHPAPSPVFEKSMLYVNNARDGAVETEKRGSSTGQPVVNETSDKFSFPLCLLGKKKRKRIMLLQPVKGRITTQSSWGGKSSRLPTECKFFSLQQKMELTSDQVQRSEQQVALELRVLFFVQSQIALAYFCFQWSSSRMNDLPEENLYRHQSHNAM